MKRGLVLVLCFLLILTLVPVVLAADEEKEDSDANTEIKDIPKNIGEGSNEILSKELKIPDKLQLPSKILFGYRSGYTIDLQTFIVLIAMWLFFLLIIHTALDLTPFFEGGKSWIGAIVVTSLLSLVGSVKSVTVLFFHLGNIFGILERWSALKLGFSIILVVVLFYVLNILMGLIKETMILGKSVSEGLKAGAQLAKLKAMREMENIK